MDAIGTKAIAVTKINFIFTWRKNKKTNVKDSIFFKELKVINGCTWYKSHSYNKNKLYICQEKKKLKKLI